MDRADVTNQEIQNGSFRCCTVIDESKIRLINNPDKYKDYKGSRKNDQYYYDIGRKIDSNIEYLMTIVDSLPNLLELLLCKPSELDF